MQSPAAALGSDPSVRTDPLRRNFNVILLGDGGVDQTAFRREWVLREGGQPDSPRRVSTSRFGLPEHIGYSTTRGRVTLHVWDAAANAWARRDYLRLADTAIILFDAGSRISWRNLDRWVRDLAGVCGPIPTVLFRHRAGGASARLLHESALYVERHVKKDQVLVELFDAGQEDAMVHWLLCQLLGDPDVQLAARRSA